MSLAPILVAAAALACASCAGASANNCDPTTIVAHGKCFFEKQRACDEIGCLPPDECVVLDTEPAKVDCVKPP